MSIDDRRDGGFPPRQLSDEALGWVVRLHSGEARKSDWAAFAEWRGTSPDHEGAAAEAERLWADASDLHRDAAGLVRPGRRRPVVSRRTVITGIAGVGATGLAGAWAAGGLRALSADHLTGVGETRVVALPDGSRATLNAMSALDLAYGLDRRGVVLKEGQALFEVRADRALDFAVDVRGSVVRTPAATFDVNLNLPAGRIAVSVIGNGVRVGRSAAEGGRPGQMAVLSKDESVIVTRGDVGGVFKQDASAVTAWTSGMYVAEGKSLDEVVVALQAYHRGWIVIRDAALKSLKVNAVLDLRSPGASLEVLAAGLPIRVLQMSQFLTVISHA